MGKTIVSWSPVHGQSATTSNTVALAAMLSLDQPYRSLLTHSQLSFSTMEAMFKKGVAGDFEDSGLKALERLVKSKLLTPQAIPDYTETLYNTRLDFLPKGNETDIHSETESIFLPILMAAKNEYDFIWVDAHSGDNEMSKRMIKEADFVLVNLPQNKYIIDRFVSGVDIPDELKEKPYLLIVSNYDEQASYSVRNIRRTHKVKTLLFAIPYTTAFQNAVNQETVMEFFFRSSKVQKGDPSYPFIQSLRDINGALMKQLGLTRTEDDWE